MGLGIIQDTLIEKGYKRYRSFDNVEDYNSNDFSSMRNLGYFFEKDNNKIYFGLYVHKRPPLLVIPSHLFEPTIQNGVIEYSHSLAINYSTSLNKKEDVLNVIDAIENNKKIKI